MSLERSFLGGLRYHFTDLPSPTTDCTGKVAIVTGATGGLGLEAVRQFARLNAKKIILGCRTIERGEASKKIIDDSLPDISNDVIEAWPVDLGSFESVKDFCDRAARLDRLDYVIENAGLAVGDFRELEGYEETITVNVLSTFLMALLLLPIFRRTATKYNVTPHATILSSDAHYFTSFPQRKEPNILQSLKGDKDMMSRYYISKLLVVLIARELAKEIDTSTKPKVIINTVNPGFCNTELWRNAPWPIKGIISFFGWLIGRTSEMGSRTMMYAVFAGDESQGRYTGDCMIRDACTFAESEEGHKIGRKVYDELLAILESAVPGVSKNV